jgi:hypothetical protein
MEHITGPVSYQKIVLTNLNKIIHLFGDRHYRKEECKNDSYLLEHVTEKTIDTTTEDIDVFYEIGYGYLLMDEFLLRKSLRFELKYLKTLGRTHPDYVYLYKRYNKKKITTELPNSSYFDSFINYFLNKADCFMKPRRPTCNQRYPNARFHNIDFRTTLQAECNDLLNVITFQNGLFGNVLITGFKSDSDVDSDEKELIPRKKTLIEQLVVLSGILKNVEMASYYKELAQWLNQMILLRIKRYSEEKRRVPTYKFPEEAYNSAIGYGEHSFLEDLAAVILEPESDSELPYYVKKLYKSILKIRNQTIQFFLKKLVDDTIISVQTKYRGKLNVSQDFLKTLLKNEVNFAEKESIKKEYEELVQTLINVTSPIIELYTIIRLMKPNYKNIIMYVGDLHTENMVSMLDSLSQLNSLFHIRMSPLYTNNERQCIAIPMHNGILSFDTISHNDKPFIITPVKQAIQKEDESYPSRELLSRRNALYSRIRRDARAVRKKYKTRKYKK